MKNLIDLTLPLDQTLDIYSDEQYSDPPFEVLDWCDVKSQGYKVSKLHMGTQTGTHIDAPCHFKDGGEALEKLPIESLVGEYFYIDVDQPFDAQINQYQNEPILFIKCLSDQSALTMDQLGKLYSLQQKVWVMAGHLHIDGEDSIFIHQNLAERGIYLVENLDCKSSKNIESKGHITILPLNLIGVSGSPCRVVVKL